MSANNNSRLRTPPPSLIDIISKARAASASASSSSTSSDIHGHAPPTHSTRANAAITNGLSTARFTNVNTRRSFNTGFQPPKNANNAGTRNNNARLSNSAANGVPNSYGSMFPATANGRNNSNEKAAVMNVRNNSNNAERHKTQTQTESKSEGTGIGYNLFKLFKKPSSQ